MKCTWLIWLVLISRLATAQNTSFGFDECSFSEDTVTCDSVIEHRVIWGVGISTLFRADNHTRASVNPGIHILI